MEDVTASRSRPSSPQMAMGEAAPSDPAKLADVRLKTIRRFATWTFLKVAIAGGILFVLVRVTIPELINAHDDALGALGMLSAVAVPVIAGWTVVSLFISTRRFIGRLGEGE